MRLNDNPALAHAAQLGTVLPVYIFDTNCPEHFKMGGASKWWLHHSLQALNDSLSEQLHCVSGVAGEVLLTIVQHHNIKHAAIASLHGNTEDAGLNGYLTVQVGNGSQEPVPTPLPISEYSTQSPKDSVLMQTANMLNAIAQS